jgi:hypothetical protein
LDDTNSGKIKLDTDVDGILVRAVEKDFVAVGPGIPCGFTTKIVPVCENGAANLYTMLVQEGTTSAIDPDYSCSVGGGGGGSTYDPCCEPLYLSLGFTSNAHGLSLGWPCLSWDGAKYTGLNTDASTSLGNGPYSLNAHFDECGRGWTAVIEPLNTKSILGQLSSENIADTGSAVGSFTYTGGGPALASDGGASIGGVWDSGVSINTRKLDDLMGCRADLLDPSIFPASSTELVNHGNASQVTIRSADCPAPTGPCPPGDPNYDASTGITGDCCDCESAFTRDPINLWLYPDKMGDPTYIIDLGYFGWNLSTGYATCIWSPDTAHTNPGVAGVRIEMATDGDGLGPYWICVDASTQPWTCGTTSGTTSGTTVGHINALNRSYCGSGVSFGNYGSGGEIYSSKLICDPSNDVEAAGTQFHSVDSYGAMVYSDWNNSGSPSMGPAKIEVQ